MSHPSHPSGGLGRRQMLAALGAGGTLATLSRSSAAAADDFSAAEIAAARACSVQPEETAGPYPLSQVLQDSSIVRSDITGGQTGLPLTITLKIVDADNDCTPVSNCAIYLWHCNALGLYSGYAGQPGGSDTSGQTWLRGVQVSSAKGIVKFSTIFPGWYSGRATHLHVQGYLNDDLGAVASFTTQLAFDEEVTDTVYTGVTPYTQKGVNPTSNARDGVFGDGYASQLLKIRGNTDSGMQARRVIGLSR